jgi:hypothetical protein
MAKLPAACRNKKKQKKEAKKRSKKKKQKKEAKKRSKKKKQKKEAIKNAPSCPGAFFVCYNNFTNRYLSTTAGSSLLVL